LDTNKELFETIGKLLNHIPESWVELTTHRLDIYNEKLAKSDFLSHFENLLQSESYSTEALNSLPTAYDYIRLGHQLSSVLEWVLAKLNQVPADQVITFASSTMPILAILRRDALAQTPTHIYHDLESSPLLDEERLRSIYGYQFDVKQVINASEIPEHQLGTTLFVTESLYQTPLTNHVNIDATINRHPQFGATIVVHKSPDLNPQVTEMVKDVQHVRRRESIAMTPPNTLKVLNEMVRDLTSDVELIHSDNLQIVHQCIRDNTGSSITPIVASSGLAIQYAIMMGLVENAITEHPNKPIALILPPNCYGGTNDQARRISNLIPNTDIFDLLVDGGHDLVTSLDAVLTQVANNNGVPIVLAEIPTNPRVEVPDMIELARVLSQPRKTTEDEDAVEPSFMVDQTFCPNVKLLGQDSLLANVKVISYSSGSKFPSGGRCIAGYCAVNNVAGEIQKLISKHLSLSDNGAAPHQINTLAENMPSMPERIKKAYQNTVEFIDHIKRVLPDSKINFVSEALTQQGFTPSVFSLDLPTVGETKEEREEYKRHLNEKLISFMIKQHPDVCKHCVSYGQLKGSYWTVPATSTQGTTKETDKDYIVRVAMAPDIDLVKLSASFTEFFQNEGIIR
jgi:cystathionine beta-lyase/cystathionine gamma-synthase